MKNKNFLDLFAHDKPIMAMLHLKGETADERFERAVRELDLLLAGGADAVIVEDYFGTADDVERVLRYIVAQRPDIVYGVNILHDYRRAFSLAAQYGVKFIQIDSMAGHLKPEDDGAYGEEINDLRRQSDAFLIGGVRFKYQPYLSDRSLEEDMDIALGRCDAIVVTGTGTGIATDIEKIRAFRQLIGDRAPLVIGAGLTPESCGEQFAHADAAIVGSYFKDTYKDTGDVDPAHVKTFMDAVRAVRSR